MEPAYEEAPPAEEPAGPPPAPDFRQLGEHVASVLAAAEASAHEIREEAVAEAGRIRQEAQREADARVLEANRARQDAEQESRARLAEAEAQAREVRINAEHAAREAEAASKRRQEELRDDIRKIEDRRQRALYELRDIVSQLQNVLLNGGTPKGDEERLGQPTDVQQATTHGADENGLPETENRVSSAADGPPAG